MRRNTVPKQLVVLVLLMAAVLAYRLVPNRGASARDVASTPASPAAPVTSAPAVTPAVRSASRMPPPPAPLTLAKSDVDPLDLLAMKRGRARPAPSTDEPSQPLARYSHLGLGRVTHVNQRPYRVLSARAVRTEEYSSSFGPILFEENGLRIFEDRRPGWTDLRVAEDSQALMVNPANGRLVVVTGTLKVSIADQDQAARLAADEKLRLLIYDPAIKLAFLRAPAGYALLPALKRLSQRPGVTLVELEAVEGRAVPR